MTVELGRGNLRIEGQTNVLAAATSVELLGATGLDVGFYDMVGFTLKNTGANPITALDVFYCNESTGARWSPRDGAINIPGGNIAAGASMDVDVTDFVKRRIRLLITSAIGSTVVLDFYAKTVSGRL